MNLRALTQSFVVRPSPLYDSLPTLRHLDSFSWLQPQGSAPLELPWYQPAAAEAALLEPLLNDVAARNLKNVTPSIEKRIAETYLRIHSLIPEGIERIVLTSGRDGSDDRENDFVISTDHPVASENHHKNTVDFAEARKEIPDSLADLLLLRILLQKSPENLDIRDSEQGRRIYGANADTLACASRIWI